MVFLLSSLHLLAQEICISSISIKGNKQTRDDVILREVAFSVGDTLTVEELEMAIIESRQNLVNTSLFNYVTISRSESAEIGDRPHIDIEISVEERWYLWPLIDIKLEDRNLSSWLKKMDFDRITYTTGAIYSNMFGLSHKLSVKAMLGYERGVDLSYTKIQVNPEKTAYLGFETFYMSYKNLDYITENNKPRHLSGGKVKEKTYGGAASVTFRPHISARHKITAQYDVSKIDDSVKLMNPNYWGVNGLTSRTFGIKYDYSDEHRDYIFYPVRGYYIGATLNLSESNEFDFLYGNIVIDLQYYKELGDRWFWGSTAKISTSAKTHSSYLHDRALGYDNFNITGYELYVVDGQHLITWGNSLKFTLLPQKIVHLNFIRNWNKLNKPHFTIYGKWIFDTGYVINSKKSETNTYSNNLIFGTGLGIDIVTYYDIVFNLGYALNNKGKTNFFFSFKAPIF